VTRKNRIRTIYWNLINFDQLEVIAICIFVYFIPTRLARLPSTQTVSKVDWFYCISRIPKLNFTINCLKKYFKFKNLSYWVRSRMIFILYVLLDEDCPHISPSTSYYMSSKIKKKSSYSIQENNNLQNKMVERIYYEVFSAVVDKLLHPLWWSSLVTCLLKQLHWARGVACKKKNVVS
jgi:hypothetical protein